MNSVIRKNIWVVCPLGKESPFSRQAITRVRSRVRRAVPVHIGSDNGPEFIARILRKWLEELGVKTLFIEPGSPWENGYVESFNGKMQDELRNREIFYTLKEAQILIERWRKEYNTIRPNSSWDINPPCYACRNPTLGSVSVVLDSGRNMLRPAALFIPEGGMPFGQIRADVSGITQTDFGYRAASP
ncbi:MAG: transposase [Chloroflexi bacterium]|nr:transposase [Chloroflexota bacterium]